VGDQLKEEMNPSTTYWRTRPSLDLQEDPPPRSQGIRGSATIVASSQHTKYGKAPTGQSALKLTSQSNHRLVKDNTTAEYTKININATQEINNEAKFIAEQLELKTELKRLLRNPRSVPSRTIKRTSQIASNAD
jgi:hypothetical protein